MVEETGSVNLAESIVVQRLRAQFSTAIDEIIEFRGETTIRVPADQIVEIATFLRDDPATHFDYLADLTGLDLLPRQPRFDVVYQLYSIPRRHAVRLKAAVGQDEAIASVTGVWAAANWAERECFDMFGIIFAGHPDLRRILLPEYWDEGHPLRKDYPIRGYQQNKWDYAATRATQ